MAKIFITGSAAVTVISSLKLEDLKILKKYNPDALVTYSEEREPVFSIDVRENGTGSLSNFGAVFTKGNPDGYACLTMVSDKLPSDFEEQRRVVLDQFGPALRELQNAEEILPAVIGMTVDEYNKTLEAITVV